MDEKEFAALLSGFSDPGKVFSELAGKQSLVLVKGAALNESSLALVNAALAQGHSGAYLSLNESFKSLADSIQAKSNARLYFVDCVSTLTGMTFLEKERCIMVNGPASLTELSLAVSMALKKCVPDPSAEAKRFLAFNSVNHFLVYNGNSGVAFLRKLLIRLRASNVTGLFMAAKEAESNPRMAPVLSSFENVVRL